MKYLNSSMYQNRFAQPSYPAYVASSVSKWGTVGVHLFHLYSPVIPMPRTCVMYARHLLSSYTFDWFRKNEFTICWPENSLKPKEHQRRCIFFCAVPDLSARRDTYSLVQSGFFWHQQHKKSIFATLVFERPPFSP